MTNLYESDIIYNKKINLLLLYINTHKLYDKELLIINFKVIISN